ncbi:putative mitogen-activated protein kinase kinase STE-STE7 family [Medicago truncatula]|uniref:mitogen-activated protein kinase kinase n=1 Tax=Medicago truncatula TaxID=3880 RepID=G7JFA9_MEDTR|nr:MAP kinase [Medicago truncatula]RHN63087.1 putative mitogen-activated protein kinase kinase STE-STE7 family [Medicago truncatula]
MLLTWLVFLIFLKGLSYLHGVRYLVHRDIKPANLLVNLKGETEITDFGITSFLENSVVMIEIALQKMSKSVLRILLSCERTARLSHC